MDGGGRLATCASTHTTNATNRRYDHEQPKHPTYMVVLPCIAICMGAHSPAALLPTSATPNDCQSKASRARIGPKQCGMPPLVGSLGRAVASISPVQPASPRHAHSNLNHSSTKQKAPHPQQHLQFRPSQVQNRPVNSTKTPIRSPTASQNLANSIQSSVSQPHEQTRGAMVCGRRRLIG